MSELLTPTRSPRSSTPQAGQLPEAGAAEGARRGHRLRTVDFSRPTKFSADSSAGSHAPPRRSARPPTPTVLRATRAGGVRAAEHGPAHWSPPEPAAPNSSGPAGSCAHRHRMLLTQSNRRMAGLEALLGGSPDRPRERRLQRDRLEPDRRLFESIIHPLSWCAGARRGDPKRRRD